jgi:hypothetical protein
MSKINEVKQRIKDRNDPAKETYSVKNNSAHTFKECDLMFINEYEAYLETAIMKFKELINIKPYCFKHFKFMKSFTYDNSLIAMDLTEFMDCVDMMGWIIHGDGYFNETEEPTPNRLLNEEWDVEAKFIFTLLQMRLSSFIALRYNCLVLNIPAYTTCCNPNEKFDITNEKILVTCNSLFIRDVSAMMDELYVTIYEYKKPKKPALVVNIPLNVIEQLHERYLGIYSIVKVLDLYEEYCCEQTITGADYFVNTRRFKSYTKYAKDVLRVKCDEVFPNLKHIRNISELFTNKLFINFVFVYSYRQKTHRLTFDNLYKHRLYNVYINKIDKTVYNSIADYIYLHHLDIVLPARDVLEEEEEEDDSIIKRAINKSKFFT